MVKFIYMVRGGFGKQSSREVGEVIEQLIAEAGVQDNVFLVDVKTHSFELMGDEAPVSEFTKRFLGKFGVSHIHSEMDRNANTVYSAFGKLMDGGLMQRADELAKRLF